MEITLTVDLDAAELAELKRIEGKQFMSAGAMHDALLRLVRRQLGEPVMVLGPLHSVTYVEAEHDKGFRHVFNPDYRPVLAWDGHALQTRGGAFRVSEILGIVETGGARRGRRVRRVS